MQLLALFRNSGGSRFIPDDNLLRALTPKSLVVIPFLNYVTAKEMSARDQRVKSLETPVAMPPVVYSPCRGPCLNLSVQ